MINVKKELFNMNLADLKYISQEMNISSMGNRHQIINRLLSRLRYKKYRGGNPIPPKSGSGSGGQQTIYNTGGRPIEKKNPPVENPEEVELPQPTGGDPVGVR